MGGKLYLSTDLGFPNANGVSVDDGACSCANARSIAERLEDGVMVDSRAPFEKLPLEIYSMIPLLLSRKHDRTHLSTDQIFPLLQATETPAAMYQKRNKDLAACLPVSRTIYAATLPTL